MEVLRKFERYRDRLTGRVNIGDKDGQVQDGVVPAAEGYILLAVRKDRSGPLVNSSGDLSPLKVTRTGELWVAGACVVVFSSNGTGITASGLTTIIPAPQPSVFLRVHALQASNGGAGAIGVSWTEKGGILKWLSYLAANTSTQRVFAPNYWDLPVATALQINCDSAPASPGVQWTVEVEFLQVKGS